MSFKLFDTKIYVSYFFICLITLFSLCDDSGFYFWAIIFSLLHEIMHIAAAVALKNSPKEISFMPFGIKMNLKTNIEILNFSSQIIILSAGCALNLILAIVFYFLGVDYVNCFFVNLALFIFNALPIGTLDGGRILFAVLNRVFKTLKTAELVFDIISFFTVSLLILFAFYAFFKSGYNVSLVITSIYLLLMLLNRQRC